MIIRTTGKQIANDLHIILLAPLKADEQKLRKDQESGDPKQVDGRNTYSIRGAHLISGEKPNFGDFYLNVFEPVDLESLTPYVFDGEVIVNAYGKGVSLTAERLVKQSEANSPQQSGQQTSQDKPASAGPKLSH